MWQYMPVTSVLMLETGGWDGGYIVNSRPDGAKCQDLVFNHKHQHPWKQAISKQDDGCPASILGNFNIQFRRLHSRF